MTTYNMNSKVQDFMLTFKFKVEGHIHIFAHFANYRMYIIDYRSWQVHIYNITLTFKVKGQAIEHMHLEHIWRQKERDIYDSSKQQPIQDFLGGKFNIIIKKTIQAIRTSYNLFRLLC